MTESIEELRAKLHAAEQAERDKADESAKAIPTEYDWGMEWRSPHTFYAWRAVSQTTLDAVTAWKDANPKRSFPRYGLEYGKAGMTYLLIGNKLAHVGGGSLILRATQDGDPDPFSHEPRDITDEEVASFKRGEIPDSLKK